MYVPIDWELEGLDTAIEKSFEKEAIETVKIARERYKLSLEQINFRVDKLIKKVIN